MCPECLGIKPTRRAFVPFYYWSFTGDKSIHSSGFWCKRSRQLPRLSACLNRNYPVVSWGWKSVLGLMYVLVFWCTSFNLIVCRKWLEKNWKSHFSLSWGYAREGFSGVFALVMLLETVCILCRWNLGTVHLCFGSRQFSACDYVNTKMGKGSWSCFDWIYTFLKVQTHIYLFICL